MNRKAVITVKSKQGKDESDVIEVVTPGEFYEKEHCYYVNYKETELSGMEGTETTLKIEKSKFTLMRIGSTTANMDFQKYRKNISMYNTPYGILELLISTRDLKINVDEMGGDVFVDYDMNVSGQKLMNTTLTVNIKLQN